VPIAFVQTRMDEKRVARLRLVERDDIPVTGADVPVVRSHQTRDVRILLRPIRRPCKRIDMDRAAADRGLRLRPRAHLHVLNRCSRDAVRILHRQTDFVLGVGLKIDDASRKAIGNRIRRAHDTFAAHAQEWHPVLPGRLACDAVADRHAGIAIFIAGDVPLEPEADQRRWFDHELAGCYSVGGADCGRERHQCEHDESGFHRGSPRAWQASRSAQRLAVRGV
jgi:hypothetical protein